MNPPFYDPDTLHGFYALNLRAGMFTGFLTLTAFLFATVQFIVVNMKQHLYGTPEYRKRIAQRQAERGAAAPEKVYRPLRRFTNFLLGVLLCSLLTSVLQFTLGLVRRDWAAGVCLLSAAATVLLLIASVVVIVGNLRQLLDAWDDEAAGKITAGE